MPNLLADAASRDITVKESAVSTPLQDRLVSQFVAMVLLVELRLVKFDTVKLSHGDFEAVANQRCTHCDLSSKLKSRLAQVNI